MQIKRFEAKNMTEALSRIKKELGSDAVILSARNLKKNGLLGSIKKAGVEVTAAVDNQKLEYLKRQRKQTRGKRDSTVSLRERIPETYGFRKYMENSKTYDSGSSKVEKGDFNRIGSGRNRSQINIYRRLLAQGIDEDAASEIEWELRQNNISPKDMSKPQVRESLTSIFQTMGLIRNTVPKDNRKQKIMVFIGASGVGKTTTVGKLAIAHAVKLNQDVGIINLDRHRAAATAQLKGFGNIAGIPVSGAFNKNELKEALKSFRDKNAVFIDTPALSLSNKDRTAYLKQILERNKNFEIHLLVSATTKEQDILGIFKRLDGISVKYLVFSKTDESESYENLFNVLMKNKIPVSHITRDQGIKESVQECTAEMLADLMLQRTDEMVLEEEKQNRLERKKKSVKTLAKEMKKQFLANKNSDVYHAGTCKWTKMINKENIIIFRSSKEAELKSFKPCRSCCQDRYMKLLNKKDSIINQKVAGYRR